MDFRFMDHIRNNLIRMGYLYNYNHFVLAGASLGFILSDKCREVFEEHIDLSIELHDIKKIFIIDHLDCGAYRKHYALAQCEKSLHVQNMAACGTRLAAKYNLNILKFLLHEDGFLEALN
jgi:hypothetical protein